MSEALKAEAGNFPLGCKSQMLRAGTTIILNVWNLYLNDD